MSLPEEITVNQLLRRAATGFSERPALRTEKSLLTYRQLDAAVDGAAGRLMSLGIRKGMPVGVRAEAFPETVIVMYALCRIGAPAVMINTSLTAGEAGRLLKKSGAVCCLIGDGYKDIDYIADSRDMEQEAGLPLGVIYLGERLDTGYGRLAGLEPVSEKTLAKEEGKVSPEDTAFILFTSGTESEPKAVRGSNFSRANSGIFQARDLMASCEDVFCVAMPIFHCFCLSVNLMAACAAGACVYLPKSRHTGDILRAVEEGRCTVLSSVPALFHAILSRDDFEKWNISSLRTGFIGGSLYSPELFKEINNRFGFTLLSSLGQTEATAGITTARMDDPLEVRAATVGHMMENVEGCIKEDELCVRGYVVMQGYIGDNSGAVIDSEGWLHTGDTGYFDGDGNLHLTGRKKDLIIRGGENISPAEIEACFAGGPLEGAAVIGVPDDHYGEELCLCIEGETALSDEEIRGSLEGRLAAYKLPRYIVWLSNFPRTATGKLRRSELKKEAINILKING